MAQPSTRIPAVLPDVPDVDDKLDFALYANTLRNIILNPNTTTPLTIGIFGSWGSGKTSLMKMIERGLKRAGRDDTSVRQTHTVWFNAWLYSKEESLWRALILQVLAGVRRWRRDDLSALRDLDELVEHLHRAAGSTELGHLSIAAADLLQDQGSSSAQITLVLQHGLDLLENIAQARQQGDLAAARALHNQVRRATATLEQERIESLDRFQQEFRTVIEKYVLPHGYFVIFVDDLDRCLPDKAVEVLEAIKLFLNVPGCIFILGIDREVVERGIHLRYGELGGVSDRGMLPFLVGEEALNKGASQYRAFLQDLLEESEDIIDGGRYLEKIIQIPFVLPPISPDAMGRFIARLAPELPHPECGLVFAQGLAPNPRQVKRAINIFTLMWELARNKPELASLIKPVRLAKLVVVQQRHSELYESLREAPEQLIAWEAFFRRRQDEASFSDWEQRQEREPIPQSPLPPEVAAYDLLPALESLLTMHPLPGKAGNDLNFVDLTADEIRAYVFLTRTVKETAPEVEQAIPSITPEQWMPKTPLGERQGIQVQIGTGASRRGFVTATIYTDLEWLSKRIDSGGVLSPDLQQQALVALAEAGSRIYAELSSDPERQAKQEASLREPALVRVSGMPNEAQVPWEIVYDHPLPDLPGKGVAGEEKIEADSFWGFKHIIERPLASGYEKAATPPPSEIPVEERPLVNLGLDMGSPTFQGVRERFEQWSAEGQIDLMGFDYPPDFRDALVKRPADIYVLHGRGGIEGGEIWIALGKERLTRRTLESWGTGRQGSALFYLDVAAGLGQSSEWWAWLDLFRQLGAGGIVAPMIAPRPEWSSDLMFRFVSRFLKGQQAGDALRDARHELLKETGNPLGLFYAHFGPAAQHLRPMAVDEMEQRE